MNDNDEDVRDWATWGIGTMSEEDTPAIREALIERLRDSNDEVCFEAYTGLAYRKDRRILGQIIHELETVQDTSRLWGPALLMLNRQDEKPEPTIEKILVE